MSKNFIIHKEAFMKLVKTCYRDVADTVVEKTMQKIFIKEVYDQINNIANLPYHASISIVPFIFETEEDIKKTYYYFHSQAKIYNNRQKEYANVHNVEEAETKLWIKIPVSSIRHTAILFFFFDEQNVFKLNAFVVRSTSIKESEDELIPLKNFIVESVTFSADINSIMEFKKAFSQAYIDGQQEIKFEAVKRNKVKEIKIKTINAKIHEIMKDKKIPYFIATLATTMKVFVNVENIKIIEIKIPFSSFQKPLQKISDAIDLLVELHRDGVDFKYKLMTKDRLPWKIPHS